MRKEPGEADHGREPAGGVLRIRSVSSRPALVGGEGEGRGERGDGGAAHGGQAGVQLRHDVIADPLV